MYNTNLASVKCTNFIAKPCENTQGHIYSEKQAKTRKGTFLQQKQTNQASFKNKTAENAQGHFYKNQMKNAQRGYENT